ncbi:MAG: DUF6882 domain-containing protein [Myxococcota bacterium]
MAELKPHVRGDIATALDTLEVPTGFAWKTAEVLLDARDGGWNVGKINARREAGDSDRGVPGLGVDPAAWMVACQASFARLHEALASEGVSFASGVVRCKRVDLESATVAFVSPVGDVVLEIEIPQPTARGQLLNDEICRMMLDGIPEWNARQQRVQANLRGLVSWRFLPEETAIDFRFDDGDSVKIPAQVLGSYSRSEASWCWSWANRSYDKPDYQRVEQLRDGLFKGVGAGAFWRPAFFCDERFAFLVAQFAAEQMGSVGVLSPDVQEGPRVYYALFS